MNFVSISLDHDSWDDPTQWPTDGLGHPLTFDVVRMHFAGATWRDIEQSAGVFTWTEFDKQLNVLISHGVPEFIYTMTRTPTFYGGGVDGANPPTDVSKYAAFASAVADRVRTNFPTLKMNFELWNEPNLPSFFTGTTAQLLAMSRAAYAVLHPLGINVLSPSGSGGSAINNFTLSYLGLCNNDFPFDVFAYHAYFMDGRRTPDVGLTALMMDIRVKTTTGFPGMVNMPTWITEGGFQVDALTPPLDDTEAKTYLTTMYSLMQSAAGQAAKIKLFAWYAWNNPNWGTLAVGTPPVPNAAGLAFIALALAGRTVQITVPVAAVAVPPVLPPLVLPMPVQPPLVTPNPVTPPPRVIPVTDNTPEASNHDIKYDGVGIVISNKVSKVPSLSGTTLVAPTNGAIIDLSLNTWTFGTVVDARGTVIKKNGVATASAAALLLLYKGAMYCKTLTNAWWGPGTNGQFSNKLLGDPRIS